MKTENVLTGLELTVWVLACLGIGWVSAPEKLSLALYRGFIIFAISFGIYKFIRGLRQKSKKENHEHNG